MAGTQGTSVSMESGLRPASMPKPSIAWKKNVSAAMNTADPTAKRRPP